MHGLVIKNTGFWYTVLTDDGQTVESKVKGKFRLKGIRSTNPVAVGDGVEIIINEEGQGLITAIDDRKNYIIRRATNLSKQSSIIACNLDQAFLVVTVVLIFNKTDLLDADERHYQDMMVNLYETVGYPCFQISAETGEGIEPLRAMLKDKVTLLSGNSGVGKSTLLNLFVPGTDARVADISDAHDTGMHTTTFSEMVALPEGGWLIDTPGIKGFGSFDMEPEEIGSYFKEIFKFSKDCRFSNCTHTHEPGCAVRKAVEEHYIAESRYNSYLSMLQDKDENKYREAY